MKTGKLWLCAALLAAGAAPLRAQATPPRDTLLFHAGPIIVNAARAAATSGGASALDVPLRTLRMHPAATLEQAVRTIPFVHVRTNARGEAYFGSRGSGQDAREVAVLLDGVPLSLNFDHRADLGLIPMTGVTSLTLVRGLPSLLYGPNVLGGVVEIGLNDVATGRSMRAAAGIDHTGARAVSAVLAAPFRLGGGNLSVRAGGAHRATDGFPLPRGISESADEDLRANADNEMSDAFVAARFSSARGLWTALTASGYSASRGAPAEMHVTNPRFWRYPELQRMLTTLAVGTGALPSPLGGRAEVRGSVGYDAAHSELDGFASAAFTTVSDQEDADDRTVSGRLVGSHTVGTRGRIDAAVTLADVSRDETLTPGTSSRYGQRLWSGALETAWQLPVPGLSAFTLTAGGAYDAADTPHSGDKPVVRERSTWGARVGVVATSRGGALMAHAGASRRARFPSLRELYSGALARVEPNPELGPELLRAFEGGITARVRGAQLQLVGFHHHIDDAIVRTTVNRKVKRVNRDETRSAGVELLAARSVLGAAVSLDVTAQNVTSADASTDTEYRAEYQPKLAGGVALEVPFVMRSTVHADVRATGSQYCLAGTSYQRLAPAGRGDVGVSRNFGGVEALVAVDNVTSATTWDQCGLPRAGRLLRFSLRLR